MNLTPPSGSSISVTTTDGEPVITVPASSGGIMRFFPALFIAFWLCAWAFGFYTTASQVMPGKAGLFVVAWLGAWTIGGAMAMLSLYRMLRPSVPESLRLGLSGVTYDSGIPPFRYNYYRYGRPSAARNNAWTSLFPKRTVLTIDRRQLQTLRLRDTDDGNRLTVDAGAARLDLAKEASEIEREWLYRVLTEKYSLAPARANEREAVR
jgi:hypothetical protein